MNFKTYRDLQQDLLSWHGSLPADISVVVGVPRSGMVAASMLAQVRNCQLASLDWITARGAPYTGGARCPAWGYRPGFVPGRVLVLDDSSGQGINLRRARALLGPTGVRALYGAVYVTAEAKPHCDVWFQEVPLPRAWEWNLFHHRQAMAGACLDVDGVLCADPTPEQNDDGPKYAAFLASARPRVCPSYPVAALVTSRLEKHRKATEAWLKKHGVAHRRLFMCQRESQAERRRANRYAEDKAEVYSSDEYTLFVESDYAQAKRISELSRKPVFCAGKSLWFPGRG